MTRTTLTPAPYHCHHHQTPDPSQYPGGYILPPVLPPNYMFSSALTEPLLQGPGHLKEHCFSPQSSSIPWCQSEPYSANLPCSWANHPDGNGCEPFLCLISQMYAQVWSSSHPCWDQLLQMGQVPQLKASFLIPAASGDSSNPVVENLAYLSHNIWNPLMLRFFRNGALEEAHVLKNSKQGWTLATV